MILSSKDYITVGKNDSSAVKARGQCEQKIPTTLGFQRRHHQLKTGRTDVS